MKSSSGINLVYLVRHGSTEWNEKQLWQGIVDTELSEKGIKEVESIGEYFSKKNIKIDLIYTSPMKRALKTALIISEKICYEKDKIIIDERLRECEIVLWNGKNINEVKKDHYNEFKNWQSNLDANIKGVEPLRSVQERMYEFLKENSVHFANKNVIIVSHAIALRMLIAKILKLEPPNHLNYSLDNASITALQLDHVNYNNENAIRIKFLNLNPSEIVW
ncbi:MAG: histidine phosphatase family protein [Fervidobacterium sp.]